MTLMMWLRSFLKKNVCVGKDQYENFYFQNSKTLKRWVLLKSGQEASTIPALWHAWIHHILQNPPAEKELSSYHPRLIFKEHKPNLTGTPKAWNPESSPYQENKKKLNYEAWSP